jgi:hypothetical protein
MKTAFKKTFVFAMIFLSTVAFSRAQTNDEKPLKKFQLSLFPTIGTDGRYATDHRYTLSINLFAGINGGVEGVEVGGFLNTNNGNVSGLQFAGFGNIINGNFSGIQGTGFMNIINGSSSGINISGFMNAYRRDQEGIMVSGFMNVVNGDSQSIATSGFMNVTRGDLQGIGVAGFMNVAAGNLDGILVGGFMNAARLDSRGIFIAGFGNYTAGDVMGIQAAGFMNVANKLHGYQLAGFMNVAREAKGLQLGFINVADTIDGVPVGFLSIVRRGGLRQFGLSASDALYLNASFKIGVPAFYNIFSFGYRPDGVQNYTAFGYGIGTRINLGHPSYLQFEGHGSQLRKDWNKWEEDYNYLSELRAIYTHSLGENLQVFAGATLYNQLYKANDNQSEENIGIASWVMQEDTYRSWTSQWWVGGRAGVTYIIR